MGIPRHPSKDTSRLWSLLIGSLLSLVVIIRPEAQERIVRPDESACPVTANLFPEQIRRTDFVRFRFREDAFPRRISLALIHPQKEEMFIEYRWIGNRKVRSGTLIVNGEGRIDCFFLGVKAIAEDDFCKEFIIFIPEEIAIQEVAFSSRRAEKPLPRSEKSADHYLSIRGFITVGLNTASNAPFNHTHTFRQKRRYTDGGQIGSLK